MKERLLLSIASAIGAMLLLKTSDETFTKILPLLMRGASAVFTAGPRCRSRSGRSSCGFGAAALAR